MTAHSIAIGCVALITGGVIWRITQAVQWLLNGRRS